MTYPYRIHPPEVWLQARDDYLAGLDAEAVCRRHDLGLSAFRRRARKYGWRRSDQDAPAPARLDLTIYDDLTIREEVETARLRFVQALERGRPMEAVRWRRLWKEMQAELDALDAIVLPGEEPLTFRFNLADEPLGDETPEEEALLLAPPASVPMTQDQPEREPSAPAPARRENVHNVHSIFSRVHISDGERPSKRAQRRQRGRDQRPAGLTPPPAGP